MGIEYRFYARTFEVNVDELRKQYPHYKFLREGYSIFRSINPVNKKFI